MHAKFIMKMQSLTSNLNMQKRKEYQLVIIIGSKELEEGTCIVKNLKSGEQKTILATELSTFVI